MKGMTRHHLFWPRTDYKTALERKFREHPLTSVELPEETHRLVHMYQDPPRKPSREFMEQFLRRFPFYYPNGSDGEE